ncbi:MAG: hypothetical protein R2856_15065 [Caldilineaceae bacterium]
MTQYNTNVNGPETDYELSIQSTVPPTPTPTNTPTPTPTPTSTPLPPVDQSTVKTLILTNRQQLESIYGAVDASLVMAKLFELAEHERGRWRGASGTGHGSIGGLRRLAGRAGRQRIDQHTEERRRQQCRVRGAQHRAFIQRQRAATSIRGARGR